MSTPRKNEAKWIESRRRWQINVQNDGERKTFTSSNPKPRGKIEAEQKADAWLRDKNSLSKKRFGDMWNAYLQETLKLTSQSNYKNLESIGRLWLLPRLKNKRVLAITDQDWQDCINDTQDLKTHKKYLSAKMCKNIRGAITSFCRYARKCKLNIANPENLQIPTSAPIGEKRILQPSELHVLFSKDCILHYGKPEKCHYIHAWRFLVLTGLRRGELCGLKNEDISDGVVCIRRSINQLNEVTSGKTVAAQRYFALSGRAASVLDAQREMLKSKGIISPYVFPDEYGHCTDPKHLYKKWEAYRAQNGMSCSLHELRHTLISIAQADVPEPLLKRAVGHTEHTDTFGIYGHKLDGEMERVASILDDAFDILLANNADKPGTH